MGFHHVFNYTPLHEGDLHSQTVLANGRVKCSAAFITK